MSTQITKESFEQFYNDTYTKVLKYTMCHCKNLEEEINQFMVNLFF